MSADIINFPLSNLCSKVVLSEAEQSSDSRDMGDAQAVPTFGMVTAAVLSAVVWFSILRGFLNIFADLW